MVKVQITGERITEESASHGDAEERGYINPEWSMRVFEDENEEPFTKEFETEAEALEWIESTIGPNRTDDGETFYAEEGTQDYATGDEWIYAAHIVA